MSCCGGTQKLVHGAAGLIKSTLGIGLAAQSVISWRRDVCRTCDASEKDATGRVRRCFECGCLIAHKTRLRAERCPRGLW